MKKGARLNLKPFVLISLGIPLAFVTAFSVLPLIRLIAEVNGTLSFDLLRSPYFQWRIGWSFLQAFLTCLLCALIGMPIAWSLARFAFPFKNLLTRLLILPFVMPTLVAAMGVLSLFGPQSLLGVSLQETPFLLLYGNLFFNLPLFIRAAIEGLTQIPQSRIQAARSLGASPWRLFCQVEYLAIRPWIGSALSLIFLYCFSGFSLALLLGGQRYATVEVDLYQLIAYELNLNEAMPLALLMLMSTSSFLLLYAWQERRLATPMMQAPFTAKPPSGMAQIALWLLSLFLLFFFTALPLCAVGVRALLAFMRLPWESLFQENVHLAIGNTLRFTALATLLATGLGFLQGLGAKTFFLLRVTSFLPLSISPVCVAFGLLLLYPDLAASLALLLIAYTLLAYPFVARALTQALEAQEVLLPQAARTLGASPLRAFLKVSLPLVTPALRRGMVFAAATALGEFAITLFLSRPEWLTLTTLIYQHLGQAGQTNTDLALFLSGLLMLLSFCLFYLMETKKAHPQGQVPC